MDAHSDLSLEDVIHRTAEFSEDDLAPLLKYLDLKPKSRPMNSRAAAVEIAAHLRRLGSNDFATWTARRGVGIEYDEVVLDVGKKLGANGVSKSNSVSRNEQFIVEKVFADTLDAMSEEERRVLFRSMNLDVGNVPLASSAAVLMPILLKQFGGFATYKLAVVIANFVAKALLGKGLTFAANVAITRTVGTLLGPIGWIATGAWLAVDLAGPAFRKTVPAVLYVATLRLTLANRVSIGVVGDGSTGKDSLIEKVFGIVTAANPVAGSTTEFSRYTIGRGADTFVCNYPGFNDYRPEVNKATDEALHHTDFFLLVLDASRVTGTDAQLHEKVSRFGRPVLVCLNKLDILRSPAQEQRVVQATLEKLNIARVDGTDVPAGEVQMVRCSFDPDPRHGCPVRGARPILDWVKAKMRAAGKSDALMSQL